MKGKNIVVTGASGALGKVVVASALAKGAHVAGIDHAASAMKATPERIELGGVDLTDASEAKKAIDAAASHFGKLDALINIAGGFAFETTAEGDPKTWQRMYALNVLTALNASRSAIPYLTVSGEDISSMSARWARFRPARAWGPMRRRRRACTASPRHSPPNGRARSP